MNVIGDKMFDYCDRLTPQTARIVDAYCAVTDKEIDDAIKECVTAHGGPFNWGTSFDGKKYEECFKGFYGLSIRHLQVAIELSTSRQRRGLVVTNTFTIIAIFEWFNKEITEKDDTLVPLYYGKRKCRDIKKTMITWKTLSTLPKEKQDTSTVAALLQPKSEA